MQSRIQMGRLTWHWLLASIIACAPMTGQAAAMNLSDTPLFVSTAVEPNVMLLIDDSGSMATLVPGTGKSRMQVAREVATNLVNTTSGMRFGIASFNSKNGGRVRAVCGSTKETVTTAIGNLTAANWTPLAESLYEVTRYFRGQSSYYNAGVNYTSPIQYRCQKNFTIVITDGMPTYDNNFPADDPDDVSDTSAALPNWDGKATVTSSATPLVLPQHSDGFKPAKTEEDEGYSLYLDDIAKFGYDIDMKRSGNDDAGGSYQDAKYPKQNMHTYTIGFAASNQMMQDAANYGNGKYFTATDATSLATALNDAMDNIRSLSSAAAAVATNSTSLNTGAQVYIAKFNSEYWSGTLFAAPISTAGVIGTPAWNSDTLLENPTAANRVIITYKPSSGIGIPFRWPADLTSLAATDLDSTQTSFLTSAAILNYLRGDESNEGAGATNFRSRPTTKLGDIVNSSPQYVGKPVGQYENENLFRQAYASASYETFRIAQASRTPMVYVGANDGMLHGFNASTGANKGKELLGYIPNQVYSNLKSLSDKTYAHKYFVDGSPTVADAEIGGAWKTVLVGGLNKGGKGIYALNVTNPGTFTEATAASIAMWEYTDVDLGYTFSKPMIVKTNTGAWAAVFGNGYNNTVATSDAGSVSTTGHAVLYIVDLADGSLIKKITTKQGSSTTPNGLSSVNGIDSDGNGTVDFVYGGDLLGNMWKFDISGTNINSWGIPYGTTTIPEPLYVAKDSDGVAQPIAARPEVSFHPVYTDKFMVYFGTGKYLEATDKTNAQTQSFYGIWDNSARVSSVTTRNSSTLLRQTFSVQAIDGKNFRVPTATAINWANHKGWYEDLPTSRERSVGSPMLLKGLLIYNTFIPSNDPCLSGGVGFLMTVNYQNGGLPSDAVLDTNGSAAGFGTIRVGGVETDVGSGGSNIVGRDGTTPVAVSPAGACDPADIACTPCVENDARPQCAQKINPKSIPGMRISWRELINK